MSQAAKRFDRRLERFWARLLFALGLSLVTIASQAQQPLTRVETQNAAPPQESSDVRRIQARRISETIKIDGVLDESVWSLAQPATDFRQQRPDEGHPATEKTEVRVLFDDKNIYFAIRAFDSEARNINARELV